MVKATSKHHRSSKSSTQKLDDMTVVWVFFNSTDPSLIQWTILRNDVAGLKLPTLLTAAETRRSVKKHKHGDRE